METPIDIARRIWPGEWVNFPAPYMTIGGLFGFVIGSTRADDGWRIYLTTRGLTQRIALHSDYATALTAARTLIAETVLELIRAVGVQDRDAEVRRLQVERDEALALAEERRVRLMIAGMGPLPNGWRREHNTMGHSIRWASQGSRGAITIFCSSELWGATPFWVNTRSKHTEFTTAAAAWGHAQALRAHIEEHGELPKESS